MEHDDRHLDSLSSSMVEYFNEVLIHKNCVSSTFRKHSVKNDEDVEFSFLLRSTCDDKKLFNQIDTSCLTEEELKKLIEVSKGWRLQLATASIEGSKLSLKLNRSQTFGKVVKSILSRKADYGKCVAQKQSVRITSDDVGNADLTLHRLKLLKNAAENLLQAGGYKLSTEEENCWVHFTTKNFVQEEEGEIGAKAKVLCGPVVNSATKTKETRITPEEYRKLRLQDLEAASGKGVPDSLVDASVALALLQVKSSQAVCLNFGASGSKGGAFLLYNSARLVAIRRKYRGRVLEGAYPELAEPEDVDLGLLKEPEEWALVFNFLLEYPSLIGRISKDLAEGRSNVHQLCDFLFKLCSLFSVYYRRVRILLEPREHLLQTIQARVLLAMSVEQVLENGLALLNINKIEQM